MCALKLFLLIFVVACIVNGGYGFRRGELKRYGPFNLILNSPMLKCYHGRTLDLTVEDIRIYFYDFTSNYSNSFPIEDAAKNILNINNLDKNRKFVMYVGGFMSNIHEESEEKIRKAYATYPDSYLIIPDHSAYTHANKGMIKGYQRAVTYVSFIGKALGKFWAELEKGGITPKNVHCVGFSLGGQILGHIGETFYDLTGAKIGRITALDPAGPCFSESSIQNQVRSEVAEYVEVYHCNSGGFGSSRFLGDIDYIVNNGEIQLVCNTPYLSDLLFSFDAAYCSHRACLNLWAATVVNKNLFRANNYYCDIYKKYKRRQCIADETVAGAWGPATAKGIFYLKASSYDLSEIWW